MKNSNVNNASYYKKYLTLLNLFCFAFAILYFYDFVKVLFSFIVSKYQNPMAILPMCAIYLLPMIYFLHHIKISYIKPSSLPGGIVFNVITILLTIFGIVGLGMYFNTFTANSNMGVYSTLYNIGFSFPYDGIVIVIICLLLNIYDLYFLIRKNSKFIYIRTSFQSYGFYNYKVIDYVLITILLLFASFYLADFFNSFDAIENAGYDGTFVYLMLLMLVPMINLVYFIIHPEKRELSKTTKIGLLIFYIVLNLSFFIALIIIEKVDPNFTVYIGKPFFPIDYAANIPVGPYSLILIMLVSSGFFIYYLIKVILPKKDKPQIEEEKQIIEEEQNK